MLQVKQSSSDSGAGGDWAVRIKAGLSAAGKQAQEQEQAAAAESGSKPRQRRLSLLLYFADAHWHTGEVEMWPDSQPKKVGQVCRTTTVPGRVLLCSGHLPLHQHCALHWAGCQLAVCSVKRPLEVDGQCAMQQVPESPQKEPAMLCLQQSSIDLQRLF
jgi:hypothetical protein